MLRTWNPETKMLRFAVHGLPSVSFQFDEENMRFDCFIGTYKIPVERTQEFFGLFQEVADTLQHINTIINAGYSRERAFEMIFKHEEQSDNGN